MISRFIKIGLLLTLSAVLLAQQQQKPPRSDDPQAQTDDQGAPQDLDAAQDSGDNPSAKTPWSKPSASSPDRDAEAGESSSNDTRIDLHPPKDDVKKHPESGAAVEDAKEAADPNGDVQEIHPWNPHKALKDVEVGDFYFKKKNYRAAQDRYQEALLYKPNDALALYRLAVCQEKLDQPQEALKNYQAYVNVLPHGPYAEDAHKAIDRLKALTAPPNTAQKK
jgi:tetratricopeptide (TPR) repeat protein